MGKDASSVQFTSIHISYSQSLNTLKEGNKVFNEMFSGDQPCQCGVGIRRFRDCCPSLSSGVDAMSVVLAQYLLPQITA
jgi:hypothetical protein